MKTSSNGYHADLELDLCEQSIGCAREVSEQRAGAHPSSMLSAEHMGRAGKQGRNGS